MRGSTVASKRHPCFKFTSNPYSRRKSAPSIGVWMSATMNIHLKTRRRPKSSVIDRVPYVGMGEPLTARSPKSCLCFRSAAVGGMTLTSAPVSTKKRRPVFLSEIYNRRLGKWPATLVAESERPSRFPPTCRGAGTCRTYLQTFGDSSKCHLLVQSARRIVVGC